MIIYRTESLVRRGERMEKTVYSTIAARLLRISPSTSRPASAPYKKQKDTQLGEQAGPHSTPGGGWERLKNIEYVRIMK